MLIAVDFDGTCVTHDYPSVGKPVGSVSVLKSLVSKGHQLILFTMRSGTQLQDAVDWFESHSIPLYGINTNPEQSSWTASPKAYAQIYIDDAALGCPLCHDELSPRPYVDWAGVSRLLQESGVL